MSKDTEAPAVKQTNSSSCPVGPSLTEFLTYTLTLLNPAVELNAVQHICGTPVCPVARSQLNVERFSFSVSSFQQMRHPLTCLLNVGQGELSLEDVSHCGGAAASFTRLVPFDQGQND